MSSRPYFKTPAFELHGRKTVGVTVELILILVVMATVMFALTRSAQAEEESAPTSTAVSKTHKAQRHTTTVVDQDDEVDVPETVGIGTVNPETQREKTMTAKFGSRSTSGMAGCKTEDTVQKTIRELKGDCNAWLKDRKAELKGKYLTGSCDESCDDCGMNLQRCNVNGTVHYTIGTVK